MLDQIIKPQLRADPEFQSALIRLAIWLFAASFIGLGSVSHYYRVIDAYYFWLFGGYLVVFGGLLISVILRRGWAARRYFSLIVDVSATTFTIFLTNEVISPFFLLYIWIFISYGTRYGKNHLRAASLLSVAAFSLLLTLMGGWASHTFEAAFMLLSLLLLPLYQYSLLHRLHEARAEAERSNRAKSEFLSTMTHELRTPLSGIVGMTHLLEGTRLTPEQNDYVHSISTAAQHLGALVHDVLDMSKIESGKVELESAPFEIRPVVQGVCAALVSQAVDKGLELVCRVDRRLPREVLGDALRVRQILFNLVGNAIKFTNKGEVLVHARLAAPDEDVDRPHLYLEVEDTGIGIPEHALGSLFERFSQVDASTTRRFGGTGLGTSIARDLARLMGGEIGVRSSLGKGSVFWVKLPLLREGDGAGKPDCPYPLRGLTAAVFEPNAASLAAIVEACGEQGVQCRPVQTIGDFGGVISAAGEQGALDLAIIADSPRGQDLPRIGALVRGHLGQDLPLVYLGYSSRQPPGEKHHCARLSKPFLPEQLWEAMGRALSRQPGEDLPAPAGVDGAPAARDEDARIHVLVAEDNEINAKVLHAILENNGYRVTVAKDGQEALELTEDMDFQMALVDLHMPRLDGLGFARAYRAREPEGVRMPMIALSVTAPEERKTECLEAGMDGFVVKPVAADMLVALVQRYTDDAWRRDIGAVQPHRQAVLRPEREARGLM
ncbi:MAG TPA: response regulator [Sedimenticola sp.]|nr:response regulator [Sedimenticola sp.]